MADDEDERGFESLYGRLRSPDKSLGKSPAAAGGPMVAKGGNPMAEISLSELGFIHTEKEEVEVTDAAGTTITLVPWSKSRANTVGDLSGMSSGALDKSYDAFIQQPDHIFTAPAELDEEQAVESDIFVNQSVFKDIMSKQDKLNNVAIPTDVGAKALALLQLEGNMMKFRNTYAQPGKIMPPNRKNFGGDSAKAEAARNLAQYHANVGHQRTTAAFASVIYEITGVRMRDMSGVGKYPLVTEVRRSSPAEINGVYKSLELRSIDVMRKTVKGHAVHGFDVLGVTFEGICQLLSGHQALTKDAIESVTTFAQSQMQMRFEDARTGRVFQVPVSPQEVEEKIRKMRAASGLPKSVR